MQGVCAQLFGEPAVPFKDKINFKLPGGDGFAQPPGRAGRLGAVRGLHITALITIDRTTVANGCLELAAGFHDRGLIGTRMGTADGGDHAGRGIRRARVRTR